MKHKLLYCYTIIALLVGVLAAPSSALAWTYTPEKVTFVNDQGITLTGYLFKPSGNGPFPAVVMMHGCAGVFSYSNPAKGVQKMFREWGDRLAKAGYIALLVDSYTPRNTPQKQCSNGSAGVSEVNDRPYDAYAGLKYLASRADVSADKIGLLGWSHGGSSVMAAMEGTQFNSSYNFKVAVAFYPGCGLSNAFGGIKNSTWKSYAPFTILIGSADTTVSVSTCQTRVSNANALGASNLELKIYQNAHHSFDGAVKITSAFTQADLDAKKSADDKAMSLFAQYLP